MAVEIVANVPVDVTALPPTIHRYHRPVATLELLCDDAS